MTVRGVLTKLVGDGLLVRVPGKGTYVATPKINAVSPAYRGVREQLEGLGYETSTRLVSVGLETPSSGVRERLALGEGDETYVIVRVRSVQGEPISLHRSYVPARLAPGLDGHDVVANQLCVVLEEHYGLPMKRVHEELEAVAVSSADAKHLGMRRGEPALQLQDVISDALSRPFEYSLDRVPRRPDAPALRLRPLTARDVSLSSRPPPTQERIAATSPVLICIRAPRHSPTTLSAHAVARSRAVTDDVRRSPAKMMPPMTKLTVERPILAPAFWQASRTRREVSARSNGWAARSAASAVSRTR